MMAYFSNKSDQDLGLEVSQIHCESSANEEEHWVVKNCRRRSVLIEAKSVQLISSGSSLLLAYSIKQQRRHFC